MESMKADSAIADAYEGFPHPGAKELAGGDTILLTGLTGFLAPHILAELSAAFPRIRIACLVRGRSDEVAEKRALGRLGELDQAHLADQLVVLRGDLEAPRLGLDRESWHRLIDEVDHVVHVGASVNFVAGYEELRGPNVLAMKSLLDLCASGKPKQLHYVSSYAVLGGSAAKERLPEVPLDPGVPPPERGYAQTKWVVERILGRCQAKGLAVTIYRPGSIGSHRASGAVNRKEFLSRLVKSCILLGAAPLLGTKVHIAPVDYCAGIIARVVAHPDLRERVYHLSDPGKDDHYFFSLFPQIGYDIKLESPEAWYRKLADGAVTGSGLEAFATDPDGLKQILRGFSTNVLLDTSNASAVARRFGIEPFQISAEWLAREVTHYRLADG